VKKLYRISALGICFLLIFFDLPIVYAQSGIPSICATGTDTDQDSITNTSGNLFLTPYDASMDDLLEVSLVFVESGTTTPYQLQAVEMIFKDIDSQINRDFTEVIGLSGTPIAIPGSSIGPQNYENGGIGPMK